MLFWIVNVPKQVQHVEPARLLVDKLVIELKTSNTLSLFQLGWIIRDRLTYRPSVDRPRTGNSKSIYSSA